MKDSDSDPDYPIPRDSLRIGRMEPCDLIGPNGGSIRNLRTNESGIEMRRGNKQSC